MAAPNPAVILVDVSGSVGQPGGEGIRSPDPAFNRLGEVTRQGWLKEAAIVRWLMRNLEATGATIHLYEFGSAAKEVEMRPGFVNTHESVLSGYDYVPVGNQAATNPHYGVELAKNKVKGPVDLFVITDGLFHHPSLNEAIGSWAEKVTIITFGNIGFPPERATEYGWELKEFAAETKKQSRPIVKGLANPRGVTAVYGTPIDWGSLPEKIRIGRRIANGRFKLEAHYPAKHFNDKKEYIDKRKAGSYCRFYDNKSPFFVARTVWDETSHPGMHMVVKNRNETYRFIVTPKANDPTEATVIGAYLVHRQDGVPVLCSGPIGELKAIGDDGDFKVTAYKKHGIRCPKKDSSGKDLAGEIPKTFGYTKRTSKKGPRKTAKDYCKPSHTFKHPTDIKRAEVVEEMDAYIDEQCTCLMCNWSGAYSDLAFLDDTPEGGPPGMDFMLVCPSCGQGDWLDDMMAEGYDEPCFSCDGIGTWDDGECEYCHGSGMMSDTLRAEMAIYNSEYFDADCGCFKKAETDRFQWTFLWKPKSEGWGNSLYAANLKDAKEQILKKYPKGSSWFQRADLSTLTKNPTVNKERWSNWDSQWNAEGKSLSFIDWAKQEEASHLKKYGTESFSAETVMIAGKKNDKMYSVAHIKGMQDKEGFTPEAIIGGNEELDNPLYAKIVEDGAKKGLYENHAESFSAECSECNTPFLKDGINSNLTQFMYFEKGMSWPCWCNECFLKDYKQWSRANESPDMPSFEELVKLRLDAESFAADWLVKRKKCKRPYCTKPIIVDFNGYCSSRCQAKNEPESYGGGAESFSADVEMIECGNCDETFTIDEGLDIGGIDYCEECYDTMKGKRPSIVTVPYLRSLGKDAESFEASRGLHKKGSKNLSKEDRRQIWMRRRKGSDFHAEDEDPADLYSQWDRVVREDLTLEESGISYEVIDSVGEGADVVVQNGVLLIPRHLYDEIAESLSNGAEVIESMADTFEEYVYEVKTVPLDEYEQVFGMSYEDLLESYSNLSVDDYKELLMIRMGTKANDGQDTFEAPYAGPGATMDIGKDTALSSFTPEELTKSSAIHGDFDQASLDYSGHQNIEVRAEDAETYKCKECGEPVVEVLKYAETFEAETICDSCEVNKATHRYNPIGTALLCFDCLEEAEEDDGGNMIPKDEESLYAESSSAEEIEFELMPYKKVEGMGILSGWNAVDSFSEDFEWDGYSLQLIVDGEWQDDVLDLPTTHPRRPLGNDQLEFINAMVYDLPHPMNNISWGELGEMGWLWAGSVMQALSHDYSTNADDNDWSDEMPMEMEHGRYDAESFKAGFEPNWMTGPPEMDEPQSDEIDELLLGEYQQVLDEWDEDYAPPSLKEYFNLGYWIVKEKLDREEEIAHNEYMEYLSTLTEEEAMKEVYGAERYGKRQRFGNRYVARNTKGEFISNVGVGASLKADRRNKSKTPVRSGFGNRGDAQKTPPVWAKPLGYVGALAAGWISASMIDKAKE